jgi:prevent-host-death family protein
MKHITLTDAKTHFSALIDKVDNLGEEFIVNKMGKPVAMIIKYGSQMRPKKILGKYKNKIKIADDFDDLPDDVARSLGIID